MGRKSMLHTAAVSVIEETTWRSLPPHEPGTCRGVDGDPCPQPPDEPCEHVHHSSQAALRCSRNRQPFA